MWYIENATMTENATKNYNDNENGGRQHEQHKTTFCPQVDCEGERELPRIDCELKENNINPQITQMDTDYI